MILSILDLFNKDLPEGSEGRGAAGNRLLHEAGSR